MKIFKLFLFLFVLSGIVFFSSCGNDDDGAPSNVIIDQTGLEIDLNWTTGASSIEETIEQADLDMAILTTDGTNLLDISESTNSFEQVVLPSSAPNDTYLVQVLFFSGESDVTFNVIAQGSLGGNSIETTGSFLAEQAGSTITGLVSVFRVEKSDNTFTFTIL